MNVVLLRLSSMGDVILIAPLLTLLAKEHRLCLITNQLYAGLFQDDPRLSAVISYARKTPLHLPDADNGGHWNHCIDLQNSAKSFSIRTQYLSRVPVTKFQKLHRQRFLLLLLRINTYDPAASVIRRYIQAASPLLQLSDRVQSPPPGRLFFKQETVQTALETMSHLFDSGRKTIALIPFSAWKNKQWPTTSFAQIGAYFIQKKWNVAILGGPSERGNAEQLCSMIGTGAFSLAGLYPLHAIGCFLTHCNLALGNDTGLSHLSRACGVKTGMLYGSTTAHFGFFPSGTPSFRVFQKSLLCRPCHGHGGSLCYRRSRPCLSRISVSEVIHGLEELEAGG
ncbi:MAG: glycosyltransferase family 9 protein [Chitinivibrionales bacterium]|nr:glycosyltransferase family 9 protein [Chitinivibrionales bacterium]